MTFKTNTIVYTQLEHTFDDGGKHLSTRIMKSWQAVPGAPKKPKKEQKELLITETEELEL